MSDAWKWKLTAPDSSSPPTWLPQPRPLAAPSSTKSKAAAGLGSPDVLRACRAGRQLMIRAAGAQLGSVLLQLLSGREELHLVEGQHDGSFEEISFCFISSLAWFLNIKHLYFHFLAKANLLNQV